jgi:hypothetical protein
MVQSEAGVATAGIKEVIETIRAELAHSGRRR